MTQGANLRDAVTEGRPMAPSERAGHVLVVDDQAIVRDFLAEVLRLQGHRVTLASNGAEALELVRKDPPHVLLTDLKMSGLDGHTLVRRVREAHPAVVPIVITGFGTVQHAVDLMREGAFDVLTKPCPAAEIVSTVSKALEHHEALQSNADLRERLRVHEKLAMIGKLAAGVAHELNNPLDATLRCVRMAMDRLGGDAEAREVLDLAHAGPPAHGRHREVAADVLAPRRDRAEARGARPGSWRRRPPASRWRSATTRRTSARRSRPTCRACRSRAASTRC